MVTIHLVMLKLIMNRICSKPVANSNTCSFNVESKNKMSRRKDLLKSSGDLHVLKEEGNAVGAFKFDIRAKIGKN